MADDLDRASEHETMMREAALSQRVQFTGESRIYCLDCDSGIPPARRAALPGVQLCVECAAFAEQRRG